MILRVLSGSGKMRAGGNKGISTVGGGASHPFLISLGISPHHLC